MNEVSSTRSFGGRQLVFSHQSKATGTQMTFSAFIPPADIHGEGPYPTLYWLSGLTCTEENFIAKSGFQRVAAELGLMVIGPDTSPRGEGVPDDPDGAYDFGLGAGFYVNAIEAPWAQHYKMYDYVVSELPELVEASLPSDKNRVGIFGHSMGGHGALTIALKNPNQYKSVSAFSPITSPMNCPWGQKALSGYIGSDKAAWRHYDACALIEDGARVEKILVDQGEADQFLTEQLKPELLEKACRDAELPLTLRYSPGYDHSYYFIATFMEDHLRWHGDALMA